MKHYQHRIDHLQLTPHPEGGYYRRIYESKHPIQTDNGKRHSATAIQFLLTSGDFSAWHRIKSDELWFYQQGCPLVIRSINSAGELSETYLGAEHELTVCVSANTWFCSEPITAKPSDYSLVSCMVTPGFDFADFEMGKKEQLAAHYPKHTALINRLCRD